MSTLSLLMSSKMENKQHFQYKELRKKRATYVTYQVGNFLKYSRAIWAFTLYWTTSERSDFYTGLGVCLHYATVIRYALRSENHFALEVIRKVIRYVKTEQSGMLWFKIRFNVHVP